VGDGQAEADPVLFCALSDAILQGREVGFTYRKLAGDVPERRRVGPYHLGQVVSVRGTTVGKGWPTGRVAARRRG
jgi:predicted DNA-binding transcriptional regulator YafY